MARWRGARVSRAWHDHPVSPPRRRRLPRDGAMVRAKAEHPDALLFFRMGDFYELFFADAEAAAAALDIALTHRGEHAGDADPDVRRPDPRRRGLSRPPDPPRLPRRRRRADGGPEDAHRQGADPPRGGAPRSPPAPSPRTPCSKPAGPTCCWPWPRTRRSIGAAWLDVSTGLFETTAAAAAAELPALLGRLEPAEILAPPTLALGECASPARAGDRPPRRRYASRRRLAEAFGAASLDAFGSFTDGEAVAAALALDYVRATQAGTLPRLARPSPQGQAGVLAMDAATRASLEILRARDGGSAAHAVSRGAAHRSPRRARACSAAWLSAPLTDPAAIAGAPGRLGLDARATRCRPNGCARRCAPRPTWPARWPGCRWAAAARATSPRCATGCSPRARAPQRCHGPLPALLAGALARLRVDTAICDRRSPRALADPAPRAAGRRRRDPPRLRRRTGRRARPARRQPPRARRRCSSTSPSATASPA